MPVAIVLAELLTPSSTRKLQLFSERKYSAKPSQFDELLSNFENVVKWDFWSDFQTLLICSPLQFNVSGIFKAENYCHEKVVKLKECLALAISSRRIMTAEVMKSAPLLSPSPQHAVPVLLRSGLLQKNLDSEKNKKSLLHASFSPGNSVLHDLVSSRVKAKTPWHITYIEF